MSEKVLNYDVEDAIQWKKTSQGLKNQALYHEILLLQKL